MNRRPVPDGKYTIKKIERKLLDHSAVADAGVISKPDPEKGEVIKAYITLNDGYEQSEKLLADLRGFVQAELMEEEEQWELEVKDYIPKTKSGKIISRHLE